MRTSTLLRLLPMLCVLPACWPTVGCAQWIEDEESLTTPANTLEIGTGYQTQGRYKAGEYDGLTTQGLQPIGQLSLRGGGHYQSDDVSSWQIEAVNLGLRSQALSVDYGEQGSYRLRAEYDQLPHARSDTFLTPYQGVGSPQLTLPSAWPSPYNSRPTTASNPATLTALDQTLHHSNLETLRTRYSLKSDVELSPHWQFSAGFQREQKDGLQAMAMAFGASPGNALSVTIPQLVSTQTDTLNLGFQFSQERDFVSLRYSAAFFHNRQPLTSVDSPLYVASALPVNHLLSAPDNQFHQIALEGAWQLAPRSRLTLHGSYGQMLQDQPFISVPGLTGAPDSLHGKIAVSSFAARLHHQASQKLTLNASYRYEDRDNQTPSRSYALLASQFGSEVGSGIASRKGSYTNDPYVNLPYSKTSQTAALEAVYDLGRSRRGTLSYQQESLQRRCNVAGEASCVEVSHTREDTLRGEYRQSLSEDLAGRLSYSYGWRRGSDYQKLAENLELAGMRKYFLADRDRNKLRGQLDWSVSDPLHLTTSLDVNQDRYTHSPYGLQDAKSWAWTLDGSYQWDEQFSMNLFYTLEQIRSTFRNSNGGTAATDSSGTTLANSSTTDLTVPELAGAQWTGDLRDTVHTFGAGIQRKGLWSGKLELNADWVWSSALTRYLIRGGACSGASYPQNATQTQLNTWLANCTLTANAPSALPDVLSRNSELRLQGKYHLDRYSAIRMMYRYRFLSSVDYAYDSLNQSLNSKLLLNGEQSPYYSTHYLGMSYLYQFH